MGALVVESVDNKIKQAVPADEKTNRVQGMLLQGAGAVGACPARDNDRGHHALRKGRASIPNGVYLITTTTFERQKLFDDFAVGCAAARCFEDKTFLGDAKMLAWVLMPDHVH